MIDLACGPEVKNNDKFSVTVDGVKTLGAYKVTDGRVYGTAKAASRDNVVEFDPSAPPSGYLVGLLVNAAEKVAQTHPDVGVVFHHQIRDRREYVGLEIKGRDQVVQVPRYNTTLWGLPMDNHGAARVGVNLLIYQAFEQLA